MRYRYDAQDRLISVNDGTKTIRYPYRDNEPDIRGQLDFETRVNLRPTALTGGTIGAGNVILTNRTRPTPYRVVQFDPDLQVFRLVANQGVTLPNATVEESLARLRLLNLGEADFIFHDGVCNDAITAAHEFGHELGFDEAYDNNLQPRHGDASDVMTAFGGAVKGYHGRVLANQYE
ncbi:MAG: hypothetical protein ACREX3_14410 [Gammaproteobacteria bacterium]